MSPATPSPAPSNQPAAGSRRFAAELGSGLRSRRAQGILLAVLVSVGLGGLLWWQRLRPVTVAVGVDRPLVYGAAIDPTDLNTAQLYLEDNDGSPIRLETMFNSVDPRQGPADVQALLNRGVRFFITTQTSSHAVPSLGLFADGRALAINVSATSEELSNRDDYFLRIIPDLAQEQRAIASRINQLEGKRLLVMRDSRNFRYTEPALKHFLQALQAERTWETTVRAFPADAFDPSRESAVVSQPFDVLYILGGDFLPTIGNLAQQFHRSNPSAPILLTPWARSPALLQNAGDAREQILIASPYPDRRDDPAVHQHLSRHEQRFGYEPYAMGIGTRQAVELLDRSFRRGYRTPAAVRHYLLSQQPHPTSLGPVRFTPSGDVQATFHFLRPAQ
jgi:branched-chain amino acid transport system substrate-binding protein